MSTGRILCLGEAIVDLICERPAGSLAEADAFVPHFGGTAANVALLAARAGATVALAGGVGDDAWGVWLRERLAGADVELDHFVLIPGRTTALALVVVDDRGEASYSIYGEPSGTVTPALGDRVDDAVAASSRLFIGSNTLVGAAERELTMRARARALELGRAVIFDPNLRLHRWPRPDDAVACANACVPGALLVRANAREARMMTGEDDPERAARALREAGARNVVISDGAAGAILLGTVRVDVPGVPARVISTIGAGDSLTATLLARLAIAGFDGRAIEAALPDAVMFAARTCERWGAVD